MDATLPRPGRTVLALDSTSLRETSIIRAVRDGNSTIVGVLVRNDTGYDITDTAHQLAMHLGIKPPGHWRLTGDCGRPEFYVATRPRIHDWQDFLTGLGISLDDDDAWKAISDLA